VRIEGHTSPEGTVDYNMRLSQARAEAVRRFLIDEAGIPESKLDSQGFGPYRPIVENQTEEGRSKNRRTASARACESRML